MPSNEPKELFNDVLAGRNAVSEALRSGRAIDHIEISKGDHTGSIVALIAKAREKRIPIKEVDSRKLDTIGGPNHQGIVAIAACKPYAELEDLFALAEEKGEPPFFIICDELEDPHNLGAIVRTAECAGAHGVIIPKRRNAGLTSAVYKASAGAVEYMPVARVSNIADTIEKLKEKGIWVYGLDMDGQTRDKTDLSGPVALVIGAEGHGLSRLVRERCDVIVSLPMYGNINSLNASVACGILMYEVVRARHEGK